MGEDQLWYLWYGASATVMIGALWRAFRAGRCRHPHDSWIRDGVQWRCGECFTVVGRPITDVLEGVTVSFRPKALLEHSPTAKKLTQCRHGIRLGSPCSECALALDTLNSDAFSTKTSVSA